MGSPDIQLPFNPRILKWARDQAGVAVEDAAKKINVATHRITDWEAGVAKPTTRQGRLLADFYGRHFLEFFSENVPELKAVDLVPDYRTFAKNKTPTPKEHRSMVWIQEWAEEQRLNALALINELGNQPPVFSANLKFDLGTDVDVAAQVSRDAMSFSIEDQLSLKSTLHYTFPNILRDKIETMGILVLKKSEITKLGARGICYFAEPLPIIVYGNESPGAQAFTLAHEFGHILLRKSGISGLPHINKPSEHGHIESWCNRFASAFLAPKAEIEKAIRKPDIPARQFDSGTLSEIANMFAMSRHAMLIRLVHLEYVRPQFYWDTMRQKFLKEEAEYKSYGRPQYYGKRYINEKGRFYTSLVMSAWSSGLITAHNAAEYMGIKNFDHLRDIREDYKF